VKPVRFDMATRAGVSGQDGSGYVLVPRSNFARSRRLTAGRGGDARHARQRRPAHPAGGAVLDASRAPPGGAFPVRCCLLHRRGRAQGLCVPAGGGLRARVLPVRECHDGAVGEHLGRAKAGPPVRRLASCVGLDRHVAEYARTRQTRQRVQAEQGGPRGRPAGGPGLLGDDWAGPDRRTADD
jgi:hypothetical protein